MIGCAIILGIWSPELNQVKYLKLDLKDSTPDHLADLVVPIFSKIRRGAGGDCHVQSFDIKS